MIYEPARWLDQCLKAETTKSLIGCALAANLIGGGSSFGAIIS